MHIFNKEHSVSGSQQPILYSPDGKNIRIEEEMTCLGEQIVQEVEKIIDE